MTTAPTIRSIPDETAYAAAVAEVHRLWGSKPGTADGDRLDVLIVLVDAYEAKNHALDLPHPIDATPLTRSPS